MNRIRAEEISFHPHSYGDPDGRLFWWNGEIYRGISHERTPFFRDLFRRGVLQRLFETGLLVDSEPVPWKLDGYGMVIRHRRIPFVSYPHEWCAAMFRSAGVAYLDLVSELARAGLGLRDTHPWNLLFEGARPIYVDLTSIRPIADKPRNIAQDKFYQYYVYPLLLMAQGQERLVRHLLPDYEGISRADMVMLTQKARAPFRSSTHRIVCALQHGVRKICPTPLKMGLKSTRSFVRKAPAASSILESAARLKEELANIPLPSYTRSNASPTVNGWEREKLIKIIMARGPRSILALGLPDDEDLEWLAGSQLVSFDSDSGHITRLYNHAVDKKLPLLPLVIDFTDPTPSRGLSSHISMAAAERLQCDMVIAMGLVKKVVVERRLRFDQMVDGAAQFCQRWVLLDFTPFSGGEPGSGSHSWYTLDNFLTALKKKFANVNLLSQDAAGHSLLLCEK